MAGPALRALRAAAPRARLDLMAAPAGAAVAPLLPEVDGTLEHSPSWQLAGRVSPDPAEELRLVARVREGAYDAAVVLTSFTQSPWPTAFVLHLAGVPVRAGMSKEFGGALLTHWAASPDDGLHQVDRALHLLDRLGVPAQGTHLALTVPDAARERTAAVLSGAGVRGGYAAVLPGASCSSRRWSPAGFADVSRRLLAAGLDVVVAGSAKEAPLVDEVVAGAPGAVGAAGVLDVPGLAALVEGAAVAVTNNSGGMHLADALGTPLAVLFAGTEQPGQFEPRTTRVALFRRPTWCSPCRAFTCPFRHECLDIAPRDVADAALRLLDGKAA
ncbi:glycosyltransferase family 9 protein [Vallicoccus soli]|uniref:Glycosyltransferase family 9 protein n=2 Tax=Vallicoccus soli TaxID=2339232 RepID=A0A3A3Z4P8_9ACTN|nr:glycosyltransferase family 9 protein [Vallicoccus soli]